MSKNFLSATLITKNAAETLGPVLEALSFADEIIVVDSKSTDGTQELAKKYDARLIERDFINYGEQKNFAESQAQGPWILNVDADEVVSKELAEEIQQLMSKALQDCACLYEIDRLNYYCGNPIYHGGWSPDYNRRLYQKNLARWSEPMVHEKLRPVRDDGPVKKLKGIIHHYTFQSVAQQVRTNIRYAEQGAQDLLRKRGRRPGLLAVLFRPFYKFIELYFFKRGCLDGVDGLIIALNGAHSQFMKFSIAYKSR
jgi:glycosyltransferase involved in cell wall biosynthesis